MWPTVRATVRTSQRVRARKHRETDRQRDGGGCAFQFLTVWVHLFRAEQENTQCMIPEEQIAHTEPTSGGMFEQRGHQVTASHWANVWVFTIFCFYQPAAIFTRRDDTAPTEKAAVTLFFFKFYSFIMFTFLLFMAGSCQDTLRWSCRNIVTKTE